MIRAAIYIRVSTEEQHLHGLSLDAQRTALEEYAKKNGMQIVDVYADEGITARKRLDKRLEFQRLLNDVKNDKIDIILVTKLDRWFRNIKDYYNTQDVLEKHNCNWRTIYENYDTSTAGGRLHINIMLSVNQDECDRTSERIKAVFKHKLENKQVVNGSCPLGYKIEDKRLVLDEANVDIVKDIFNHFEKYGSIRQTVHYVNMNYGPTNHSRVKRMLKNKHYIGEFKDVKDFCPAIIDVDQFNTVQRILEKNRRTRNVLKPGRKPVTYIFVGMLRCKECGHNLAGQSIYKEMKSGLKHYKSYRCDRAAHDKVCKNRYPIPEASVLELYLLKHIKPELEKYKVAYEIKQKAKKKTDNKMQIDKLKNKCDKLKDLYLEDLIDKDTYKKDYESMQAQILELEKAKEDAPSINLSAIDAFLKLDFESVYKTLTDLEKRRLWLSVIDYIEVGTNRNDITVHFLQ